MDDVVDQSRVFKVFAGSSELSPFHQFYANDETILRSCAGRLFPHYNGEDVSACYWALRKKAVLFDVPEKPVEVSGKDAIRFLNIIFTRELSTLNINRGRYVLACISNGGLLMDAVVFRLSIDRFWIVQPDGDLLTWLEAHKADYNVCIKDPNSRVLQIQGPRSFEIMNEVSDGLINKEFRYFHSGFFHIGDQEVYISRTGWTGELGYEVYTQGDKTNTFKLWECLLRSGAARGLQFSSMQAMNIRRIEAGIFDSGGDFDREVNPFEAGLGKFVDLSKSEFVGRAALIKATRKKRIFGILCHLQTPKRGYSIIYDREIVGVVTTGAKSLQLGVGVGYVKFLSGMDASNKMMVLRSEAGKETPCQIVELPFYDKEKRIRHNL